MNTYPARLRPLISHAGAWGLFILYELGAVYCVTGKIANLKDGLVYYLLNILLFYVNACVVFDFSFSRFKRHYLALALLLTLELVVYLLLKYGIDYLIGPFRLPAYNFSYISRYVYVNIWRGLYFVGLSTTYWLIRRTIAYRRTINEAEKQQLLLSRQKAEIERNLAEIRYAHLQQQINPHFLFNTLNFLYNTVYKHSPEASGCILQLSEILRYSLEEYDETGQAELSKEVEQINNFIAINRMRYDYDLFVDVSMTGEFHGEKIIPLALLTLVENIFKHGNLKSTANPAKISLDINDEKMLKFNTWNLKKARTSFRRTKSIGLQNTIKRLQYAYGSRYKLTIDDQEESYGIELVISL
ncbi:sensor histidine kinase [Mucilaginibacter sp. McL0603]|uniref:sensor histidine kinase n=1 Tax=Mucilaginibacter sp. McL0603 TaxID=3415670 RepID=UPI003CF87C99